MSNLSISTSLDANVLCRFGVNAELKISWTQLNTGRRFFCYKNTKVDAIIFDGTMMKYRLKQKRSYGYTRLITNINICWCCTLENSWSNNSFTCCTR
ncbi:hypothetical protein H5410_053700, partial [Solanum commersonii]